MDEKITIVVKLLVLPKFIYRFSEISLKNISSNWFIEIGWIDFTSVEGVGLGYSLWYKP